MKEESTSVVPDAKEDSKVSDLDTEDAPGATEDEGKSNRFGAKVALGAKEEDKENKVEDKDEYIYIDGEADGPADPAQEDKDYFEIYVSVQRRDDHILGG